MDKAFGFLKNKFEDLTTTKTELEKKLKEATASAAWGVPVSLLQDIALHTTSIHDCTVIMDHIWEVLQMKSNKWTKIQKALDLLEVIVQHGDYRCVQDVRSNMYRMRNLSGFSYKDSDGYEKGEGIRHKASVIIELVSDEKLLTEKREIAAQRRGKFGAVSSHATNSMSSSSYAGGGASRFAGSGAGGSRFASSSMPERSNTLSPTNKPPPPPSPPKVRPPGTTSSTKPSPNPRTAAAASSSGAAKAVNLLDFDDSPAGKTAQPTANKTANPSFDMFAQAPPAADDDPFFSAAPAASQDPFLSAPAPAAVAAPTANDPFASAPFAAAPSPFAQSAPAADDPFASSPAVPSASPFGLAAAPSSAPSSAPLDIFAAFNAASAPAASSAATAFPTFGTSPAVKQQPGASIDPFAVSASPAAASLDPFASAPAPKATPVMPSFGGSDPFAPAPAAVSNDPFAASPFASAANPPAAAAANRQSQDIFGGNFSASDLLNM